MVIELVRNNKHYVLKNVPTLGSFAFFPSFPDKILPVQSFDLACSQNGHLPSLAHSVAIRSAFYEDNKKTEKGFDCSNEPQYLSTISIKFLQEGIPHIAFTELDMSTESKDLLQKGYNANSNNKDLFLPLQDSLVSKLLNASRKSKRIVPALDSNPLTLSLDSEYGSHPYNIALFGSQDIAQLNAEYLQQNILPEQEPQEFIYDYTGKDLKSILHGKEESALIRLVTLGGTGFLQYNYDVIVCGVFNGKGKSRSIHTRKK